MSVDFFASNCTTQSSQRKFGLCDDLSPANNTAYIDENDGARWIAVVENSSRLNVSFVGIDNCPDISLTRADGKDDNRCDGLLYYEDKLIFVELKDRNILPSRKWLNEAHQQLLSTILAFEKTEHADSFRTKRAYIANKARPSFTTGQLERIARFNKETNGYALYIQNRIEI